MNKKLLSRTNVSILILLSLLIGGLIMKNDLSAQSTPTNNSNTEKAIFAGGCFWCMEQPFDEIDGVISTISGYIGGKTENPTYEQISTGQTGHAEAVEITFDPSKVSYEKLLDRFWKNIDPTTKNQQFADRGTQYRSGIFYLNDTQKQSAENSLKKYNESGKFKSPIVTEITKATTFYPAEDYHQNYYKKNPIRYNLYKSGSGRASYVKKMWPDE